MAIKVGVDNYSYHRLLGDLRQGEDPVSDPIWNWEDTIRSARRSGADMIAVETYFIAEPSAVLGYARHRNPVVMLSWGHPHGLEFGTSVDAERDLVAWLSVAAEFDARRMRIVVGHPALRQHLWTPESRTRTLHALARVSERAKNLDVELVVENHADLTAAELADVIEEVGADNLGVCFDIANAVRVGDDPMEATRTLLPYVRIMHVKDVDLARPYGLVGPPSVKLGTGSLPVRQVIDTIVGSQPDVWLLVEIAQIEEPEAREEEWMSRDIGWIRDRW
jgi:sugar phosphate isomerase/epimerase